MPFTERSRVLSSARVRVSFEHVFTPGGWLSPGGIEIDEHGMITAIEPANAGAPGFAIPGMPNLHSHAFQRAMSGLTEQGAPGVEDSFWTWRTRMYGLAQAITPDELEVIAAQLYAEMLERGYTAVGEFHYLHHDRDGARYATRTEMSDHLFAATEQTGIALTHLPVLYLHGGFNKPPRDTQTRFIHRDVDDYLDTLAALKPRSPLIALGVAPHSLRAVNPSELSALISGARALLGDRAPIHIHVAEQEAEVAEAIAVLGARPVAFLLDRCAVDQRFTLVHATHVDPRETERLAKSGAIAGLCPTTEANLGDGLFPAAPYFASGGAFGVGSDSHASISVTEELRLLEYGQRLTQKRRNVLSSMYARAVEGGARALAQPAGALAVGRRADIVVLDPGHPRLCGHGTNTVLDAWIFGGADDAVSEVMVAGKRVVERGRHVDSARIRGRFEALMKRLIAAAGAW